MKFRPPIRTPLTIKNLQDEVSLVNQEAPSNKIMSDEFTATDEWSSQDEQLEHRDASSAADVAALISGDDSAPDYEALLIRTRVRAIGLPKFRFLLLFQSSVGKTSLDVSNMS